MQKPTLVHGLKAVAEFWGSSNCNACFLLGWAMSKKMKNYDENCDDGSEG